MNILIYADKLDAIRELITAAASFDVAATPKVFAATDELAQEAASYAESYSAGNVPVQDAHSTAAAISQAARALNCDVVMLLADRIGKDLAGHLAQATGAGALTGVTAFGQNHSAFRCALGGAVVEESVIESDAKIFAIAPKSFALAEQSASSAAKIDIEILQPSVVVKSVEPKAGGAPMLLRPMWSSRLAVASRTRPIWPLSNSLPKSSMRRLAARNLSLQTASGSRKIALLASRAKHAVRRWQFLLASPVRCSIGRAFVMPDWPSPSILIRMRQSSLCATPRWSWTAPPQLRSLIRNCPKVCDRQGRVGATFSRS